MRVWLQQRAIVGTESRVSLRIEEVHRVIRSRLVSDKLETFIPIVCELLVVELFFLCHTFKLTAEVREFD
jgi:hypothetical protein